MEDQRPDDAAFNLRFRAAVQDQNARSTLSPAMREHHEKFARRLRVQADLIDQGIPIERVLRSQSDKI
jgi:hypothetical protein